MITLPSIGQYLQAHFFEDLLLVCILIRIRDKVSPLIYAKFVMGPKGIIESEISEFLFVIFIEKTSGRSDHIDTKLTIKSHFSLIEWPHSDTDFNTHF